MSGQPLRGPVKTEKKATDELSGSALARQTPGSPGSTALGGALARVLLAACGNTTLQANALATATGAQGHAWQCGQWGGEFTICFGDDFIAHLWLRKKIQNSIKPQERPCFRQRPHSAEGFRGPGPPQTPSPRHFCGPAPHRRRHFLQAHQSRLSATAKPFCTAGRAIKAWYQR